MTDSSSAAESNKKQIKTVSSNVHQKDEDSSLPPPLPDTTNVLVTKAQESVGSSSGPLSVMTDSSSAAESNSIVEEDMEHSDDESLEANDPIEPYTPRSAKISPFFSRDTLMKAKALADNKTQLGSGIHEESGRLQSRKSRRDQLRDERATNWSKTRYRAQALSLKNIIHSNLEKNTVPGLQSIEPLPASLQNCKMVPWFIRIRKI